MPTTPDYDLVIDIDPEYADRVNQTLVEQAIRATLAAEQVPTPAEISLRITDNGTIQELNRDYRGLDQPTDVLSFGFEQGDFVTPPDGINHLGEVIIAYPYTEASAAKQGHSVERELTILTVHGVLHVLGYDDEEEEAAQVMFARQDSILSTLAE